MACPELTHPRITKGEIKNIILGGGQLFRNAGYGLSQVVLDASRCGVPQKRKRFFLIGELNGEDCALESLCKMTNLPIA